MKKVLRVKEANRYFFTQNPTAPPYYFPEKSVEELIKNDANDEDDDNRSRERQVSPATQAKIDSKLLFMDNIVPIPCDPAILKKALEDRRKREGRDKNDMMKSSAALIRREKEQKIARKLKKTKEIHTIAADYCQSRKGDNSIVALALIDNQVLIYQVKQSGVKISMVESFSFYAKFQKQACIASLCLDHYVTDGRPIIVLGSQHGDIAIYYIDHVNSQGKVCQKLIEQFNFFERGVNKLNTDSEDDKDDGDDSLTLDRASTGQKSFVFRLGDSDAGQPKGKEPRVSIKQKLNENHIGINEGGRLSISGNVKD